MSIFQDLSVIALRQVAQAVGFGAGEVAFNYLMDRFTDHSDQMNSALQKANDRAWQTLESALAGPSVLDRLLMRAEDKTIVEQVRVFLESSQLKNVVENHPSFCKTCLAELRAARNEGKLNRGQLASGELARHANTLGALSDPKSVLDAEWIIVQHVATDFQQTDFLNLAKLLNVRPLNGGSPILATSVRYFFRREIETNQQLFQGLTFSKLNDISERQEKMLGAMTSLLTQHDQHFAKLMNEVLDRLGVIEETLRILAARQEKWFKKLEEWQKMVMLLLEKNQLQNREVRPADSFSIRNDGERQMIKKLIEEYRRWPEEKRQKLPELLNKVGKLEVATGEFAAAQQDFREVAKLATEPNAKAEAFFNAYQAALEQKKWPEALAAIKEAVALDPQRFAPFPFKHFDPQRILGAGGFGVAFLCKHRFLGMPRVIKAIRTSDLDRNITDVFSEAKTLEKLNHHAIVRLVDCDFADADGTRPFIVMDFFDGMNLESYVETHGHLAHADLVQIAILIAEALQTTHANGILHRDVKPGNILLRRESGVWQVKLIDFGLAVQPSSFEGRASTQGPQSKTIAGKSIAGTMHYAAPEQLGDLPAVEVGTYSDVYGFGKTCFYALFKTPHPDDADKETLPDSLRKFLSSCTAQKLANRLPDFTQVLTKLREIPVPAASTPPPPNPRLEPQAEAPASLAWKDEAAKPLEVSSWQDVLAHTIQKMLAEGLALDSLPIHCSTVASDFSNPCLIGAGLFVEQCEEPEEMQYWISDTLRAAGKTRWVMQIVMKSGKVLKFPDSKLKNIERKIAKIERFQVTLDYSGDKEELPSYDYQIAANQNLSVAQWREGRFRSFYPDCGIKVLLGDGRIAFGGTKLSTVRDSYY